MKPWKTLHIIAQLLNITETTLSIMAGHSPPSFSVLAKVCSFDIVTNGTDLAHYHRDSYAAHIWWYFLQTTKQLQTALRRVRKSFIHSVLYKREFAMVSS